MSAVVGPILSVCVLGCWSGKLRDLKDEKAGATKTRVIYGGGESIPGRKNSIDTDPEGSGSTVSKEMKKSLWLRPRGEGVWKGGWGGG